VRASDASASERADAARMRADSGAPVGDSITSWAGGGGVAARRAVFALLLIAEDLHLVEQ
jgi:hypothetical protein